MIGHVKNYYITANMDHNWNKMGWTHHPYHANGTSHSVRKKYSLVYFIFYFTNKNVRKCKKMYTNMAYIYFNAYISNHPLLHS